MIKADISRARDMLLKSVGYINKFTHLFIYMKVYYIIFPGFKVSQNDCRMWNKSYKYNDTYTVHLKHSESTYTHI
jgi:hypothetical protein